MELTTEIIAAPYPSSGSVIENKGILVESSIPITLVAHSIVPNYIAGSYLVKPAETMGKLYLPISPGVTPVSYSYTCKLTAVSIYNDTHVTMTMKDGGSTSKILNELQTFVVRQ